MSRSRNGCTTCKRRHRKCDETKPACLACEVQGLACDGYSLILRWDVGVASRGPLAGVSTPVRGIANDIVKATPKHATRDPPVESLDAVTGTKRMSAAPTPQVPQSEPTLSARQEQEQRLVAEFFKENVYLLYSTWRDHELPGHLHELSRDSESLCAIVSAMHLYLTNPLDPGFAFDSYYSRGLDLFRSQLGTYTGSLDARVLCAGLFICTLNLYRGIPWSSMLEHMVNVHELPRQFRRPAPHLNQPVVRFLLEAVAVMDLPTFVRGRPVMTIGIWSQMRAAEKTHSGVAREREIETLSGLPRSLLDIFAMLGSDSAEVAFLTWPGEVGEVPSCHLWEAYRLAGILTGRRLRSTGRRDQASLGPASIAPDVLVGRLIAALDALCETRNHAQYKHSLAANALLYPYVAARLEVAVLQRHVTWIDTLRRVYRICKPYGDTTNARNVEHMLEEAFDAGDDGYDMDEQAKIRDVEIALF